MNESDPFGRPLAEYSVFTLTALSSAFLQNAFYNHFVEALTPLSDLRSQEDYQTERRVAEIANFYADNLRKAKTGSNAFMPEFCPFFQSPMACKSNLAEKKIEIVSDKDFHHYCTRQRDLFRQNRSLVSADGVMVYGLSKIFDNNDNTLFI